jgi:TetR/AcrR family transcriptional regulator, transcriptional repressor for nem operon
MEIHNQASSEVYGCQLTSRSGLSTAGVLYRPVMGHSKVSKANTHARLVESAAARFKERGVDGISLADLMKDLELTHGGFYKHFASRDELVAEALELALTQSGQAMRDRLFDGDKPDIAGFVDFYLDESHRDARAAGCAVAALAGDAPRKSAAVQAQFRKQIERNLETLSAALGAGSADESRATALLILSALYGALTMARAVGDSPLSREVLQTVRKRVLNLSGPAKKPRTRAKAK